MPARARRLAFLFVLSTSFVLGACRDSAPAADAVGPSDCPVFTAAGRLPATVAEADAQKQKGTHFSNKEIRARYVCWVTGIGALNAHWKMDGLSAEERSKRAYQTRHVARMIARAMMESVTEVKALQARDQEKYGHPDGPTFEWLVQKAKDKGLSGDAVYEEIIASSQRTDPATNKAFGIEP